MSKVSLIITIYKNEENIMPFYEEFQKNIAPAILKEGDDYEIIMINDDSPDNSWGVMKQVAAMDSKIKLLRLSRNFGAIAATFTGLTYATGDCITGKACDLQEPSELTLQMYREWKKGEKVLFAVREARSDGFFNDLASNIYYWIMRNMVVHSMPKGGFDCYMIDKHVKDQIVEMNDKNSNIALQLMWLGFHPKKVYYVRQKREIGKSSWTLAKKIKLFMDSIIGFSYVPIRFMTGTGVLFLIFSIIFTLKVLWARLNNLIPVQGYATLVIITLFSAGMIMFTLGILGEYIWRTMEASRNRPLSVVQDAIGFGSKDLGEGAR
ncbi:glycosyltransferase family 2 protein [Selenomonas ruminantium]|uniref:Dolichol-phosphate mannosyltransferase n=1 Tax=Selenomonas ruminantium TaxID=971 RepID=A0A1K1PIS6_SELRU|nr:glycosyltransferase family 2 protein [Selenomonas ruminantium]SFW47696.1 dolichol-phosphate mannosyltransferase [Selenomonas ruminantium]